MAILDLQDLQDQTKKERPFSLSRKIYSINRTLLRVNVLGRLTLRNLILGSKLFYDLFLG